MTKTVKSVLSQLADPSAMIYLMALFRIRLVVVRALQVMVSLVLFALSSIPASAEIGPWIGEGNARVRFLGAGVDVDGRLTAGIEIVLKPGWKTYWRSPGDAGIPPRADFSASTNVDGPIEIEFPVPHRSDDGFSITNVYENRVVLLVNATATDAASPTTLAATLDIGVCADICIPEHYDLTLNLGPGENDIRAEMLLANARAALPKKAKPGVFAVGDIARSGGSDKRPIFEIGIVGSQMKGAEVFVEGPADWYSSPPTLLSADGARATYSVAFSRVGAKTPIDGTPFRVTIVSPEGAIEDFISLD